jgi:flagellar motor switch protein FliM
MEQVLSQDEIDALLRGLSDGDIEEPPPEVQVQPTSGGEAETFDFLKFTKGKKEKLPALEFICDRFSKSFRSSLSLFIEKEVEVSTTPVQYVEYFEFIKTLPLPTNMNIVVTEGLKGFFIVIFDAKLIFSVLETVFGSASMSTPRVEGREFTKIEFSVIKKLIELVSSEMEKAWSPVYEVRCKYSRSEINPNYITMVTQDEMVSLWEFAIEVGEIRSWMKVCMPYGILETVKSYLISTPSREDMDMKDKWYHVLKERVCDVPLELRAVLGTKKLSLKEFLKMTEANVIIVDRHVDDLIDVQVQDKPKFKGKMGIHKGNKAVRVEEILQ